MKKILLFGAFGNLGKFLLKNLADSYQIYAIDICKPKIIRAQNIKFFYLKKNYYSFLKKLYKNNDFYAVIHCHQFKDKNFLKSNLFNLDFKIYKKVIDFNLSFTLFSIIEYIKIVKLKKNKIGRVINFNSVYSCRSSNPELYKGTEMANPIYYTISKSGLLGMTKYVAAYYKKYKTLCNCISPHGLENNQSKRFIDNFSQRSPIGRLSHVEEILPAIQFLLNENNTYTNGIDLLVDGGWTSC